MLMNIKMQSFVLRRFYHIRSLLLGLGLFMVHSVCLATPTIGEIAEILISGTDIVTRLLLAACFVIGIGLIIVGFVMYSTHRKNPKFIPLDRVVTYIVLGAIVLTIPFLGKIFTPTSSTLELQQAKAQAQIYSDIDAPLQ